MSARVLGCLAIRLHFWLSFASIFGCIQCAHGTPLHLVCVCVPYSCSAFQVYSIKVVLHVIDQCCIYLLIAGTYTPILSITLHRDSFYSVVTLPPHPPHPPSSISLTAPFQPHSPLTALSLPCACMRAVIVSEICGRSLRVCKHGLASCVRAWSR